MQITSQEKKFPKYLTSRKALQRANFSFLNPENNLKKIFGRAFESIFMKIPLIKHVDNRRFEIKKKFRKGFLVLIIFF